MVRTKDLTISLTNVYKRFKDVEAVSDATLQVSAGEVIGFVGPNGAGKTTTISMIMGFINPTKGSVALLGKQVEPQSAHELRKYVGYVAGDMVLPGHLTGQQFLDFQAGRNGRDPERYKSLLHNLSPILERPIKTLSRGNKQKVALCAALQHDPKVLILDEPTSGLDPLMQDVFLETVRREAKRGVTVLMSSHILSEVSSICSRIVFMRAGKIVVDEPIGAISEQLGKQVIIKSTEAKNLIKFVPKGVTIVQHDASQLHLSVKPEELKGFLRWIVTKNFDDITIEDRDLDDMFHELYKTGRKAS